MTQKDPILQKKYSLIVGFFLLGIAVYGASLTNSFSIIDDGLLIFENNAIRAITFSNLSTIFTSYDPELYIPLTLFSYQIDYLIGGYNPFIYHFTSLLLHIASSLLVLWIVFLLSGRKWLALFCGIFFAVHPIQVEAVVWAAARKDVLAAFFFLGSLVAYLRWCVGAPHRGAQWKVFLPLGGPAGRPYILSIFLFLLGLLSKVTVVTLPIILLLVDWQQKRKITKDVLIEKIPYFALSIFFGLVAFGGKQDLLVQTNIFEKILLACKTTVFGLRQILFPVQLSVFHPELHPIQFVSIDFLLPIAVLIIIATALWRFRKTHPELLFGALFFLITLAPSFLTVTKGGNIFFFSDRYAYLPSIGILFALGSLFFSIKKIPLFHRMMTAGVIAVVFSVITVHQSLLWGSGVALFSRAATLYPEFYLAHINVGAGLRQEGKKEEAIKSFKKAVSLYKLPNTYGLIGQVYAEEGNYPEAIEYFEKGLSLLPEDPELHYGLGQVYALRGDFLAAEESYKTALRYSEDDDSYSQLARRISGRRDKIFFRLGLLEGKQGNHDQAMRYQKMAIKENPYFTDAYYNLAVGLGLTNQRDEAILYLKKVLEIDPLHIPARVNLGILYGQTNRLEEAMNELQRVLQIDPLNPTALSLMEHLR